MASIKIDTREYPISRVLPSLLFDRTTKKNIIFATESYEEHGDLYGAKLEITKDLLICDGACIIQPRVLKDRNEQQSRTRKKAEVFTPAWVCCMMNDHCDTEWFGRECVFGKLDGQEWRPYSGRIEFPKGKTWKAYVDSRRLEITCGEAPYIVSRYDMGTGEPIPIEGRIGILDRKLRVVGENTESEEEWLKWAKRAFQSVYGYEYQGDNLFVSRINLLLTFTEYLEERWKRKATDAELDEIARIISWNVWQMDGLKGTIPLGALYEAYKQLSLFDLFDFGDKQDEPEEKPPCRVFDWRGQKKSIEFNAFKEGRQGSMKFDYIIGNPPYQEETDGTSDNPIYNMFMDAEYEISEKVELITPARFLFNAGKTPKAWNKKMLEDEHLSILHYEQDSSSVFSGTDIKGGVAISYHDKTRIFGAIEHFIPEELLRGILVKVRSHRGFAPLSGIINSTEHFKLSDKLYQDHPEFLTMTIIKNGEEVPLISKGHESDLTSNILDKNASLFSTDKPMDGNEYVRVYGRQSGKRIVLYFRADYMQPNKGLSSYKVVVPESNNNGTFGETLVDPFVADKDIATTQTFITMGFCEERYEAESLLKYICGKFARAMLGTLKITQHNKRETWRNVPLQDFTSASDIDWSQPVAGIDQQLYRKYGLSDEEIAFIESHVKEMA